MGKYQVQWWHDSLSFGQWVSVKSFIFQRRALKYISKRVIDNSFARKWRIVDTSYADQAKKDTGFVMTRVVCTIERKAKEGDENDIS
jgi:hypothetical protein